MPFVWIFVRFAVALKFAIGEYFEPFGIRYTHGKAKC